jgi:curved DNA-binding protein CbpA
MKDFYYILGIPQTASAEDVKKAYRKLVQKFHPDKNDGDPFFAERFQEIQEAYDTLGHPARRTIYDADRRGRSSSSSTRTTSVPPIIDFFKTDKTAFAYGDAVTFSWKTSGANKVTIIPFGQVPTTGEKTYRLKDFKNPTLSFQLLAERTGSGNEAKANIVLQNTTYRELYQFFKQKISEEGGRRGTAPRRFQNYSTSHRKTATRRGRNEQLYTSMRPVFVAVALVIVILLVLFLAVL